MTHACMAKEKREQGGITDGLVRMMFGRSVTLSKRSPVPLGQAVLRLKELTVSDWRIEVKGLNLEVRGGEVIGLAGLEGSGQRLVLQACAGLRRPTAGQVWIDNTKLKALLNYAETAARSKDLNKVSRKEQEIIILVSQGFKNREIADKLKISEQTVKAHISHIFRKVKVTNRSQLVPLAMKFRLPQT